jgi:hypothetical protein
MINLYGYNESAFLDILNLKCCIKIFDATRSSRPSRFKYFAKLYRVSSFRFCHAELRTMKFRGKKEPITKSKLSGERK